VLVVALASVGPARNSGFRSDELLCEEAAAHLDRCCPGFEPAKLNCTFIDGGGCGEDVPPMFDEAESRRIRAASCSELRSTWCTMVSGP
jgi:hypothetical protein